MTMRKVRKTQVSGGAVKIKPNISRNKYLSVYGARLAHRPLETFGRKYLVFS